MDHSLVARLDEKTNIGVHERDSHGHFSPVREDARLLGSLLLDAVMRQLHTIWLPPSSQAEDIVPSTTVESRRVFLELVQDFLHLESSRQRLNQDRGPDDTLRQRELASCQAEHVVPKPGLEVVLHLGKIVVRPRSPRDKLTSIVEEVETKVKDGSRHRLAVNQDPGLVKVPSSWSECQLEVAVRSAGELTE
jgi:hypothetical protein